MKQQFKRFWVNKNNKFFLDQALHGKRKEKHKNGGKEEKGYYFTFLVWMLKTG